MPFLLPSLLQSQIGDRAIVRVKGSIGLSPRSEPQPDVAVLRWRDDFYAEELPGPADVLLVVEVAESSGDTDRDKTQLYGRAGIAQAWVVDLPAGQLTDSRSPTPAGYVDGRTHSSSDAAELAALPDVAVEVGRILA